MAPAKTYPEVVVGQVWRDRDPRMLSGNRRVRVRVIERPPVGEADVFYVSVNYRHQEIFDRVYRSRMGRFVRAFELIEQPQEEGKQS